MSKKNKEQTDPIQDNPEAQNIQEPQVQEPTVVPSSEELMEQEKDRYLRLFADFENYKRRTSKERIELFKTASQDLMIAMLPILDDFDRALKELEKSDKSVFEGVLLINNKLNETLKQKGLKVSETKAGEAFNADIHEAITQIPAPTDDLKGKIIDVIEMGYTLGDKIIRYPKVVIGQ
ncbi:MAG: molecular chaperone GrpE [Cryomorphaceae bacterium BACL21 MAG-121220-bin10]|jgi:molecular chaperone GrpE|nr:MAG: molecular chaperone GrpE [Cryomorphaceae bacterium BACL21 MAG-121220-bin10]MDA0701531.1 nucleotide exchange factor GrpE [Bacteroidota bacterium]